MALNKRMVMAAVAMTVMGVAAPSFAMNMIGNSELTGQKGSIPVANPAKSGQITLEAALPAPVWFNGDTPDTIKDGMEYCLAAEIAWRARYDKLELVNVHWDPLITGQTSQFDLAVSERSDTPDRKTQVHS